MRTLGYLGLLAAIVIGLVLMLKLGRSLATGNPQAKTGSQKASDDMKKDRDGQDPQEALREGLRGGG